MKNTDIFLKKCISQTFISFKCTYIYFQPQYVGTGTLWSNGFRCILCNGTRSTCSYKYVSLISTK